MSPIPFAAALAASVVPSLLVMGVLRSCAERFWPAEAPRATRGGLNIFAMVGWMASQAALGPVFGALSVRLANALGGGFVVLPSKGWGLVAGVFAWVLITDFCEYGFHWLEHKVPAFWAMHSLHHSDQAYDSMTAGRHFWAEPAIKTVTIWLAVGLLFKTPPSVVAVYVAVSYYHYLVHSNLRLDFGRWSWLLNGPGYHRLHHSRAEAHFDVNFASLFPIFDVLSGAYRRPRPGELIQTGLDTGDEPKSVAEALFWPARGVLRRKPASERLATV